LEEYVSIYNQQISAIDAKIDAANEDADFWTNKKLIREEKAEAETAKKAKEAEYNDIRTTLDGAKTVRDAASKRLATF
jgi:hypothetical protein